MLGIAGQPSWKGGAAMAARERQRRGARPANSKAIGERLLLWTHAGGVIQAGLVRRRQAESALWGT
jgi:GH24 family phage-related lysozyme (muramidase)